MFGAPIGTRTPDLLLRRQLLYPAELLARTCSAVKAEPMERVMGIEPTRPAWKAGILAIELHPQATCVIISWLAGFVNGFFQKNPFFLPFINSCDRWSQL